MDPSEYAYHDDSVIRAESASANCRNYPASNLPGGLHPEHFIHCDGTQLKLADSNFGQEQFRLTDYYVLSSGTGEQLLFIFPKRVSLTTITLHYYSNSDRGLPRLRFYAVPDNFNVWETPPTNIPQVQVTSIPPGREPAGCRSVSINVTFDTNKVLMYKHGSNYKLVVSEAQFFVTSNSCESTIVTTDSTSTSKC